nr:immunoglobulin light chain junction region [Macaca mulatta]
CMQGTELWMF